MESFDFPYINFYFHKCCQCFIDDGEYRRYESIRSEIPRLLKECNNKEYKKILNNLLRECESCNYSSPKFSILLKKILTQS